MLSVPSMGVRRTALFTFWDSGKRVDSILMTACPEVDFAVRCATTKHTVSATLQFPWQLQKHYILQRLGGDCLSASFACSISAVPLKLSKLYTCNESLV